MSYIFSYKHSLKKTKDLNSQTRAAMSEWEAKLSAVNRQNNSNEAG